MTLDAIAITAIRDELRQTVLAGRVQRVVQASASAIGLELYAQHARHWILLSGDPQRPRVHLVTHRIGRAPDAPSPLLLLLRKHLVGRRLTRIDQPDFERTLMLGFTAGRAHPHPGDKPDEATSSEAAVSPEIVGVLGSKVERATSRSLSAQPPADDVITLIIEAIGRYGNVILVDGQGVVLESTKRVPAALNRYRVVLPRHPYVPPPPQPKLSPDTLSTTKLSDLLGQTPPTTPLWQILVAGVAGISPQMARELVFRACGSTSMKAAVESPEHLSHRLLSSLEGLLDAVRSGEWSPSLIRDGGRVVAFAPYRLTHLPDAETVASISAAVEEYYQETEELHPVAQAKAIARRELTTQRSQAARKRESLERALANAGKIDLLRLYGETLLAHAHEIRRGQDRFTADGVEIELDPALTAVENAQACFRRYRKAQAALAGVPALLETTQRHLDYLDQVKSHIDLAATTDQVRALRAELAERHGDGGRSQRPARQSSARQSRQRAGKKGYGRDQLISGMGRFSSTDGHEILVGHSGRQNDILTFDLASPDDLWFHARGVPGAHVVLREAGRQPSPGAIAEAAQIAARFSAAGQSSSLSVDYTACRFVRRARGGYPGLVTYVNERTLQVRPDELVERT